RRTSGGGKTQAMLFQREVSITDDHVVQKLDGEQLAGLVDLGGESNVVRAGGWVAGRVVVHQDDRGAGVTDGVAKHLRDADDSAVDVAVVDFADGHDVVAGVEHD